MLTFRDVETAAYCPRKLYYRRRSSGPDEAPPPEVAARRELAFRYEALLDGTDDDLAAAPLAVTPTQFRANLGRARAKLDAWDAIADPAGRTVHLAGQDCRGVAHKVLETDPPVPSLVFTGDPPETGVWHPQRVRAIAAAKALSWERETRVERAIAEYPAHGVIREVPVEARRADEYQRAIRAARRVDGPPPRTDDRAKCDPCEFVERCGVKTRSLRSLL